MEEKKEFKLFREKSLETIETPESLNDYLRVTSPGVWLVMAAVIVLLLGGILWSIFGRIDTKRPAAVITTDGETICCVIFESFDQLELISEQRAMEIDGKDYSLIVSEEEGLEIGFLDEFVTDESRLSMIARASGLSADDLVVCVPVDAIFEDGVQSGTIVTESLQPFSLLFGKEGAA